MHPVLIKEPIAQSVRHADAAIIGGAAPQADQEPAAAPSQNVHHQLPNAPGGGMQGLQIPFRQRQPGAAGHFHHGGAVRQDAVFRVHEPAQRSCHLFGFQLPADEGHIALAHALPAVGHGDADQFRVGAAFFHFIADNVTDFPGAYGAFEGVRRKNDFFHFHNPLYENRQTM